MKDNKHISLFIDTATKVLSFGAVFGEKRDSLTLPDPKRALEDSHLAIKALGERMGFALADVDAFYTLLGPGSNTGIRLGLTIPRTLFALNPKLSLFGSDTLPLFLSGKVEGEAVLSDRKGNLYDLRRSAGEDRFQRIDLKDIASSIPLSQTVYVERGDGLANEELKGRNLILIDTIEMMMDHPENFKDYSEDIEHYLPHYTQVIQ